MVVTVTEPEVLSVMNYREWLTEEEIKERIVLKHHDPDFPQDTHMIVGRPLAFLERLVQRGQAQSRPRYIAATRRLLVHGDISTEYQLIGVPTAQHIPIPARPYADARVSAGV